MCGLQKLLNGAKQRDLNAVKGALEEGADVDVGVSPHGFIPLEFSVRDDRVLVVVKLWI